MGACSSSSGRHWHVWQCLQHQGPAAVAAATPAILLRTCDRNMAKPSSSTRHRSARFGCALPADVEGHRVGMLGRWHARVNSNSNSTADANPGARPTAQVKQAGTCLYTAPPLSSPCTTAAQPNCCSPHLLSTRRAAAGWAPLPPRAPAHTRWARRPPLGLRPHISGKT